MLNRSQDADIVCQWIPNYINWTKLYKLDSGSDTVDKLVSVSYVPINVRCERSKGRSSSGMMNLFMCQSLCKVKVLKVFKEAESF